MIENSLLFRLSDDLAENLILFHYNCTMHIALQLTVFSYCPCPSSAIIPQTELMINDSLFGSQFWKLRSLTARYWHLIRVIPWLRGESERQRTKEPNSQDNSLTPEIIRKVEIS